MAREFFPRAEIERASDKALTEIALISEAIRLAIYFKNSEGARGVHITAIKSWVTRKLRGVIPDIASGGNEDKIMQCIKGDTSNLVFIGDLLELENGYYEAAPTRFIKIGSNRFGIVSGLPTFLFTSRGSKLEVRGPVRHITGLVDKDALIQDKESFVGHYGLMKFDLNYVRTHLKVITDQIPSEDWECYQGNLGNNFVWRKRVHEVECELGKISMWRLPGSLKEEKYQLRIDSINGKNVYSIPSRLFKHACLFEDKLEGKERIVYFESWQEGVSIKLSFPPPEAQLRWLTIVGDRRAQDFNKIEQWNIPLDCAELTSEIFDVLPIHLQRGIQ